MYRFTLALLLSLLAPICWAETPWVAIQHAIAEYVENPSPRTANAALETIPVTRVSHSGSPDEIEANRVIYAPGPMQTLERRVRMKERESVALAFRMRNIADGAFLEDLDIILGQLIRPAPKLFLVELQRAKVSPRSVGGLVGNLGDDFVDQTKRQCKELGLRREALAGVSEPSLSRTKEQALTELSKDSNFCRSRQ